MPARRASSRSTAASRATAARRARRAAPPPPDVPVLRLSSTDDVLAAVPYLLGFHPQQSLVAMGLGGPRGRLGVTMRMDLDGMPLGEMAQRVVRALHEDGDSQAFLLIYADTPPTPSTSAEQQGDRVGLRPGEDVVAAVRSGLRRAGIKLRDAVLIADGRWWSYLCKDATCCPPDGSVVRTPEMPGGPSLVAATAVGAGLGALPDRDALAASLEPTTPWAYEATHQAIDRIGDEFAAACLTDPKALADSLLGELEALVPRFADPRPTLSDQEVARIALGLHLLEVRDTVITWTTREDAAALQSLLIEVVRRTEAPEHVPAATVLAWCAYLRGEGALAGVAIELVARSKPDYSLAQLVDSMLQNGIHPDRLREVTLATAEDLRRRREAPDSADVAGSDAEADTDAEAGQACG